MKLNRIKLLFTFIVMLFAFLIQSKFFVKANDSEVSEEELASLSLLVEEKLGLQNFEYELINSFNQQNRFFLIEESNCYLIYDRNLCEYLEFSDDSNSLFYNIDDEKIYIGPGYYFSKNGNNITNLLNDQVLTNEQIIYYSELENDFITLFNLNKNMSLENETNTYNTRSISLPSSKYINGRYYFDNMCYNYGDNNQYSYSGCCAFVALGMVLSYYDTFENDSIIDEEYDVSESQSFASYNDISLDDYTVSPGTNSDFHSYIIDLGVSNNHVVGNSYSMFIKNIDELVQDYFNETGLNVITDETALIENKTEFIKTAIYYDKPVIVGIIGVDHAVSDENISHAVVAYGYDENGIYVHMGWKNNNTINININNYTITNAVYFYITDSHVCSDNYEWSAHGCTGTVCPCGIKTCNHETLNFEYRSSSDHIVSCNACNYSYIEEHDDLAYESMSSTQHRVSCLTCDDYYYELHDYVVEGDIKTCTECGHQEEICYHENLTYENYTSAYHNVNCANCDYSYTEEHDIYVQDHTQYCSKCDYEHVLSVGHNYIYIPITGGKNHKKQCSICSSSTIEACIALGQVGSTTRTCALCGQTMNSTIGFVPLKKDEDEIVE